VVGGGGGGGCAGHEPSNHGQFSSSRFAFLFEPGTYTEEVPVGYVHRQATVMRQILLFALLVASTRAAS